MSKKHVIILTLSILCCLNTELFCQQTLFQQLSPYDTGYVQTSTIHKIYWERSGKKGGTPIVILHGGPGGKISTAMRRLFDPAVFDIVQFDQRGTGKSKPFLETSNNTTTDLCSDINSLLDALKISEKVIVFGLSWGATLALVYSEMYPEKVAGILIAGVFLCEQEEINHFYKDVYKFYPENVNQLNAALDKKAKNIPLELYKILSNKENKQAAENVRKSFTIYESWMESTGATFESAAKDTVEKKSHSISLLENYYLGNQCFLTPNSITRNLHKLTKIPVFISNGRLDMITPPYIAYELSKKLNLCKLEIVEGSGHGDLKVAYSIMKGVNWVQENKIK